ncbi:peptidyl-prolyl cis-trans isomerase B [mine drainage metagenome]|uniref:peptidylprolyl isomerase n=1 Tax=mine drainage metagenome TaxID=410659 RepID=A0A1J5QDE8_9ZZZZ
MSKQVLIVSGLMVLGGAILGGMLIFQNPMADAQASKTPVTFPDTPSPNLVIEVAGHDHGKIVIDLLPKIAPKTVAQIVTLAKQGAYDGVVFHRVIDGFMAQTGDVQYGKHGGDLSQAGLGASTLPDVPAEFSKVPFSRGTVGMARASDPNSGNSQFFIMFAPADNLNGQYTVFGHVISGMDVVDAIKRGDPSSGQVTDPDYMAKVTVQE